jgi:hypothetical protein
MEGLDGGFEEAKRDTVSDGTRLMAAVKAELLSDAAAEAIDETTQEELVALVEERTGIPARMVHRADVDPSFDIGIYRRADGDFPGLLLTTSVDLDAFDDREAAVEELQQRRDTLCRVCEEMDFAPYILEGGTLKELVEEYEHAGGESE